MMSMYVPCMSHKLKDVIWIQLGVKVHCETNLWQAQGNLVGTCECGWMDYLGWLLNTPKYRLFRPKAQEGHLVLAQKPNIFNSIMVLCSSSWCFLFPRYKWTEWDSSPIHHRDPNVYATWNHAPIRSQHGISMDATFGTNDVKYHVFIDGIRFPLDKGASRLGHHKLANMWKFGGVVGCLTNKVPFTYATLETIMFHYEWCSSIKVGCTLSFFLLHCLMFLYCVKMGIAYHISCSW